MHGVHKVNAAAIMKGMVIMAAREGIDEDLKTRYQMAWVAGMNSIRQRAEKTILDELIYT